MKILVTGSAGHLGEAIIRTLRSSAHDPVGLDLHPSPFTDIVGSIVDREFVARAVAQVDAIMHTATLHKPHVATHSRQDFVDTNISGTLNLLEEAVAAGVSRFVFTSTTSAFGAALVPVAGAPAAWITEDVTPVPRNIYGVKKTAVEDLCRLFYRTHGLPCIVLRTARFFPEPDDSPAIRDTYEDENAKANEFLFRRVDIEDAVQAHICAVACAPDIGFARYIISATTPFGPQDLAQLRTDAPHVVGARCPAYQDVYEKRGWQMFPSLDRVYVNEKARHELDWSPTFDFVHVIKQLAAGGPIGSDLARAVGAKGYHQGAFENGLYPVA
jgi:UDP-glucose 4-epimerase